MSLRVWLPLNGNLNNQGLSDITVTNNGATVDNNGKIGKCYSFGAGASGLEIPSNTMNTFTTECSLSMWLYIVSWNNNYATFFQAGKGSYSWNDYIFGVLRIADSSKLCFTITEGISSSSSSFQTPDLSLNTWYHLTFVYKSGHCIIYINGELYQDYSTSYVPSFSSISKITLGRSNASTYQTNCKLNDIRIYDHALSPKEVEVLSRGLVCHYPLNGGGRGGDNLYTEPYWKYSTTKWGYGAQVGTVKPVLNTDGSVTFTGGGGTNSQCYIHHISNRVAISASTTYTVSCKVTASGSGTFKIYLYQYDSSGAKVGNTMTTIHSFVDGETKTISNTITTTSTTVSFYAELNMYGSPTTSTMLLHANSLKIEKSDHPTPWIPNPADSAYTAMGYNSTTEYDVSGYGYNGTKNGTLTYSSDTARYSVSTVFDGNSASIQIPNLYEMLGSNTSASYSISVWTYKSKIGTKSYQTILGGGSGFEIEARNAAGTDPQYVLWNWGKVAAPYEFNKWNHMVFTKQGSEVKLYVNGVLANQGTSSSAIVNSNYFIGAWNTATQQNYEGQMSDFRLYATALSDSQVAELYNTAISVANNGALMGYELVEV